MLPAFGNTTTRAAARLQLVDLADEGRLLFAETFPLEEPPPRVERSHREMPTAGLSWFYEVLR